MRSKKGGARVKFLRTASTGRLLAMIVGVVVAIAAGTAIAVAASGSGPVPKRERLAVALHGALAAPAVKGISARISFTNSLIGASDFQGVDPLLQGTPTGRLWLGDHRLRLELQSDNGDAQIVVNGNKFWISDPAQHTVYAGTLPISMSGSSQDKKAEKPDSGGIPTIATIQSEINALIKHTNVSGAIPGDIAGQAAYTVRISPRHDGGLLGSIQLAWDAVHGVPLRIAVYAHDNPSPVLQLEVTDISYGSVPGSVFNISPPAGSKIVKMTTPSHLSAAADAARLRGKLHGKRAAHEASGYAAVAHAVPFKLVAPSKLVLLPRHSVSLLDMGGKRAALVTYGEGLGGIIVIEQAQSAKDAAGSRLQNQGNQDNGQPSFSLPTVSINGATGQELVTALGTVLTFNRDGVGYTVLGSIPKVAAEAAARAL
jgi:outer membrane lipoprotein-sorting protein